MSGNRPLYTVDTSTDVSERNITEFLREVEAEYFRARNELDMGEFHTGHEAASVMYEEWEEVWEEVKHPTNYGHLRNELVQLAAMAMAAALELV